MKERAYAKINLILDILSKREDGYHNIDFLMTTIDLYDEVEIKKSNVDIIEVLNNQDLSNEENLAFKALALFKEAYNINECYKVTISKKIPVAAGLAGGSSDAACVLRILNKICNVNVSLDKLLDLGMQIGSDVAFCLYSSLARVQGKGEKITLIKDNIPKSHVLVINSGQHLSTKKVYNSFKSKNVSRISIDKIIKIKDYKTFYKSLRNDLEYTSYELEPSSKAIKDQIEQNFNVTKIMISGSGPTLLIFDNKDVLEEIKKIIKQEYKHAYLEVHKIN